jgi:hypothetical protein
MHQSAKRPNALTKAYHLIRTVVVTGEALSVWLVIRTWPPVIDLHNQICEQRRIATKLVTLARWLIWAKLRNLP